MKYPREKAVRSGKTTWPINPDTGKEYPSMTDQSMAAETDVNYIVQKFMKTGTITHLSKRQGVYADVSEVPDLLRAHQIMSDAELAFSELDAETRRDFDNNPLEFIKYLQDPQNAADAAKIFGLTPKPEDTKSAPEPPPPPPKSTKAPKKDPPPNDDQTTT